MADSLSDTSLYPLPTYNFLVRMDYLNSGRSEAIRCARVSGLEWNFDTLTYRDGLSFLGGERITKYYISTYHPITLEQGTVARDSLLVDWLRDVSTVPWAFTAIRSINVQLLDSEQLPVMTWKFHKAMATKISGPQLDAHSDEVAIDRLELQVASVQVTRS